MVTISASVDSSSRSGETRSKAILSVIDYAASAASFCALATASSMVPTM